MEEYDISLTKKSKTKLNMNNRRNINIFQS